MTIVSGFSPAPEEALSRELLRVLVRGDGNGLVVEVQARGYLDDSIAGENFLAKLERDGDQWRVVALGRQFVCARGERAVAADAGCM
jgi:hypothetical protein